MATLWDVNECSVFFGRCHLRGWACDLSLHVVSVVAVFGDGIETQLHSYGLPSPDVAAAVDPAAHHCRFDEWMDLPAERLGHEFCLRLHFTDGTSFETSPVYQHVRDRDPFHQCWGRFIELLRGLPSDAAVLEIGSRARSAITRRSVVGASQEYVGLDILPGPNVDVVGDAHELSLLFGRERFDAVFSFSVFEHLAMPWKAVLEINRVLRSDGIVFTATHQTWPVHEAPWDFWRFSRHSWPALFNASTGFELVVGADGEPAQIHANFATPITCAISNQPAYLGSAMIARKVGTTPLSWPVKLQTAAVGSYPPGVLEVAPF